MHLIQVLPRESLLSPKLSPSPRTFFFFNIGFNYILQDKLVYHIWITVAHRDEKFLFPSSKFIAEIATCVMQLLLKLQSVKKKKISS